MSQRRKEEQRKGKINKIITIIVVLILLIAASAVMVYYFFFKTIKPHNFIPENPMSYMQIDINPDSDQNVALENLALRLGNENIFEEYLKNQFFQGLSPDDLEIDSEDLKSWIGERLVISRIRLSNRENRAAQVIEIKNLEKAEETLHFINESIKKRGGVVSIEEFKGIRVVFVQGESNIAYGIFDNFLLVSEDPSGVKTMVDTVLGRNRSLDEDPVYKRLYKKLKGDDYVAFAFVDLVKTLQYFSAYSSELDLSFIDKFAGELRMNVGIVLAAGENGVEANFLMGGRGDSFEKKKGFEPSLAEFVSKDSALYIEGQDIQSLIEKLLSGNTDGLSVDDLYAKSEVMKRGIELQLGFSLDDDFFDMLSGRYAFTLMPYKEGKGFSAGIILDRKKGVDAVEKMKKIEDIVVSEINKNLIKDGDPEVKFFDREYRGKAYRFASLPDSIRLDIYYVVLEDKIILASSKGALQSLIDSSMSSENTLQKDKTFQRTYKEVKDKDATRLIYVDMPSFYKFLDNFEYVKYTSLQDEFRKLDGLSILNKYSGEGGWAKAFLSIREND